MPRSGARTWNICQCFAVFCTFVAHSKVKQPHEMSMITFSLSDRFLFFFVGLQLVSVGSYSRDANIITKPSGHTKWGWEQPFCNISKQIDLPESNWRYLIVASSVIYFFLVVVVIVAPTFLCAYRLCYLPPLKKKKTFGKNEHLTTWVQGDFRFSEYWQTKKC